jgi:hypothetical protein
MPCHEKRPAYKHANGEWTWEKYKDDKTTEVGVLLNDLCVVDVDDHTLAAELELKFPILTTVPRESTRKGMHYFFRRSDLADKGGYYDSRSPVIPSVDFKTRCQNRTRGFVVTTPSTDKEWIDAPWDVSLPIIPDDLLAAVALPTHRPVNATLKFDDGSTLQFVDSTLISRCIAFQPVFDDSDTCDNLPVIGFPRDAFLDMVDIIELGRPTHILSTKQLETTAELSRYVGVAPEDARHFDIDHPASFAPGMRDLVDLCPDAAACVYVARDAEVVLQPVISGVKYVPIRVVGNDTRWLFHDEISPGWHTIKKVFYENEDLATRGWNTLPPIVRKMLDRNPGHVMLAGGSAVSLASPHVSEGSDYDLFVFGTDAEGANKIVWDAMEIARYHDPDCVMAKTGSAVTFYVIDGAKIVIQIILKLYASPADVLSSFDISVCQVGLWRDAAKSLQFMGTEMWHVSMRHLFFWVDPATFAWSTSSVMRIFKYYAKGFDIFFPGLKRAALKDESKLLEQPSAEGRWYKRCEEPGMMSVFHIETIMHRREKSRLIRAAIERAKKFGQVAHQAALVARTKENSRYHVVSAKNNGCLISFIMGRCKAPRPFSGKLAPVVQNHIASEASHGPVRLAFVRDYVAFSVTVKDFAYRGYHRNSGYGEALMAEPHSSNTFYAIWQMIIDGWRWLEGAMSPVEARRGVKMPGYADMSALQDAKGVDDVAKVLDVAWVERGERGVSGVRRVGGVGGNRGGRASFFARSPRVARMYDLQKYVRCAKELRE